jgi:hypothetical protein
MGVVVDDEKTQPVEIDADHDVTQRAPASAPATVHRDVKRGAVKEGLALWVARLQNRLFARPDGSDPPPRWRTEVGSSCPVLLDRVRSC